MSSDAPHEAGRRLHARGWHQGSLFTCTEARLVVHRPTGEEDDAILERHTEDIGSRWVVTTQDCDIVALTKLEPYVEAISCSVESDKGRLGNIERSSARWFVVDPPTGLVADARHRATFTKDALEPLQPEPWPSDSVRLDRFVRWLARRYDRPAIPDALVAAFQDPLAKELRNLDKKRPSEIRAFSSAVQDVRIHLPNTEEPPFDIQVVFLLKKPEFSDDAEKGIDIVSNLVRTIGAQNGVRVDPDVRVLAEESMSVEEYFATRPLYLENLTYRGDEVTGAEPPRRA